jgi:tRNA dimethylallyltransferase
MKPNVIVIAGPTASGKTKLSIELAKQINGEIISSDSMQIYKWMDIGTAKVTKEEAEGIKHYLIDIIEPNERYTVSNFKKDAENAIEEILSKGKTPIVVGGTGLYIDSLIYGIEYQDMEFDEEYRIKLMEQAETEEGLNQLYNEALEIDKQAMEKISPNDTKRIVRILEIYHSTGKTKTELEIESRKNGVKYNYHVFVVNMDREKLYERINLRVDMMINAGLIEEVKDICNRYNSFPTAMQGLGYKEVVEYLENKTSKDEMIDKIKKESRHYAKRQLTWFRKDKNFIWLDGLADVNQNVRIIREEVKI